MLARKKAISDFRLVGGNRCASDALCHEALHMSRVHGMNVGRRGRGHTALLVLRHLHTGINASTEVRIVAESKLCCRRAADVPLDWKLRDRRLPQPVHSQCISRLCGPQHRGRVVAQPPG